MVIIILCLDVLGGARISSLAEKTGCRKEIWLVDVQSAIGQKL